MKSIFPIVSITCLWVVVACSKPVPNPPQAQPITQTVAFRLAQAKSYDAPVYNGLMAEVKLAISKENIHTGANTIEWDSTISMQRIQLFPQAVSPALIVKNIGNIIPDRQQLRTSVVVRYITNQNYTYHKAVGTAMPQHTNFKQVEVTL
ncbi:MAG: hypothetical protein ACK4HE_07980 [Chitinophagaceae bacterium]